MNGSASDLVGSVVESPDEDMSPREIRVIQSRRKEVGRLNWRVGIGFGNILVGNLCLTLLMCFNKPFFTKSINFMFTFLPKKVLRTTAQTLLCEPVLSLEKCNCRRYLKTICFN